ncbi:MAG: ABC transporter substrate-binding protein [Gemmatimonadota bacterium]|nr:ABC transporter substrate-binding protein [Gemmatimonadota bacterium]
MMRMRIGRSRERRMAWGRTAVVLAAWVPTLACGDAPDPEPTPDPEVAEADRYGGTAVIAGAVEISTFNPAATHDALSQQIQQHAVLMTLLRSDEALRPVPYLAESWEINDDSTRVVFHLRRDVSWHDGEPTTARDVEFTFRALKDPEAAFPNAEWFEGWEGPELIDRYTIRFAVRPHAGLLAGWARLPIMPRHLMSDVEAAALATHEFGANPVGNGPYRFAGRDVGGNIILEANDEFPAALGGRPYLDRVVYRNVSEPQTQLAELRAGGVHLVQRVDATQLERAGRDPALIVEEVPSRAYGFIAWNGKRALFQDPSMRRALTMAIDRAEVIGAARHGLGTVANGPIGPWHPAYPTELTPIAHSEEAAIAALEALGWTDTDRDGIRDRDGTPLAFEMVTTENRTYSDVMTIVQAQLRQVGVDVTLRIMDGSALIDAVTSPERRFDAFVLEWEPDLVIDDRQLFSCEAIGQAFQFASYCNEELEPILQAIPSARSNAEVDELLRRYVEIVNRDQPFTFLYFAEDANVRRRDLRGVTHDIRGDLYGIARWWLHPAARGSAIATAAPAAPDAARPSPSTPF